MDMFKSSITEEHVFLWTEWLEENKECSFEAAANFLKGIGLGHFGVLGFLVLHTSQTQEGRLLMCKWIQEMPEVDYSTAFVSVIQMMFRSLEEKQG